MKVLSKKEVIKQIEKIAGMGSEEAKAYRLKVSTSDIDNKSRDFIYRAIDSVLEYSATARANAEVVGSELRGGEI